MQCQNTIDGVAVEVELLFIKQQMFISRSLEAEKSSVMGPASSVSGMSQLLVDRLLLTVTSHGSRDKQALWGTDPIHEGHTLMT